MAQFELVDLPPIATHRPWTRNVRGRQLIDAAERAGVGRAVTYTCGSLSEAEALRTNLLYHVGRAKTAQWCSHPRRGFAVGRRKLTIFCWKEADDEQQE